MRDDEVDLEILGLSGGRSAGSGQLQAGDPEEANVHERNSTLTGTPEKSSQDLAA
jgi:hypothetical protein